MTTTTASRAAAAGGGGSRGGGSRGGGSRGGGSRGGGSRGGGRPMPLERTLANFRAAAEALVDRSLSYDDYKEQFEAATMVARWFRRRYAERVEADGACAQCHKRVARWVNHTLRQKLCQHCHTLISQLGAARDFDVQTLAQWKWEDEQAAVIHRFLRKHRVHMAWFALERATRKLQQKMAKTLQRTRA